MWHASKVCPMAYRGDVGGIKKSTGELGQQQSSKTQGGVVWDVGLVLVIIIAVIGALVYIWVHSKPRH